MRRPSTALRHPVIILARGHGTRLQAVARGRHKTLEQIGGSTILGWILRELRGVAPTRIYLHQRDEAGRVRRPAHSLDQAVLIDDDGGAVGVGVGRCDAHAQVQVGAEVVGEDEEVAQRTGVGDRVGLDDREPVAVAYITWAIPRGALVAPIGFPAGHNINTPADLDHARGQVTGWTTLRERNIAA